MALTDENGTGMVMPVQPMSGYGYPMGGFGGGFGNDFGGSGWWIILLFLLLGNNGWGNGFGGNSGNGCAYPWMLANNTDNLVASGFNQAATAGTLSGIQSQIAAGFSGQEVAACNRALDAMQTSYNNQIATMNQSFANSQAIDNRLDTLAMSLQQCCCDNRAGLADLRYTVATEACADRASVNDALRDVTAQGVANTNALLTALTGGIQSIKDELCADRLDAERRENANLRSQLNMAQLQASQTAQTAAIRAGQVAEIDAMYNRLRDCPVPTYNVPNPNCCYNNAAGCGCGCGNF